MREDLQGLQTERVLRLLVDSVRDYAIFMLTPDGHIASWNPGAQRIKGYAPEDIIGRHFRVFYPERERRAQKPEYELVVAAREGRFEDEGWRIRKDGSRFWANVIIVAVRDEQGVLVGFGKITRDLTDRRQLMEQVQLHARDLERRIVERDRSLADLESCNYSVSHDLRAPLRAIEGFVAALKEELPTAPNQDVRDDLSQITNAVKRMNALIDDLLNYSRVSRGEMEMADLDLQDVMGGVLDLDPTARIRMAIEPGVRVRAQRSALTQALVNLVDNALKFHKPGLPPAVDIVASRFDDTVRIAVKDEGIGIAPEHHERIFQIFQRLHAGGTYRGTGIGLALVKRIAERMGGTVGVESEAGKGSTFWIDVPAA
jgi:PAS domain S-box-containing protein